MNIRKASFLAAAAGALALTTSAAHAQTANDDVSAVFLTGFEPPAYLAGPLVGQDKWTGQPEFLAFTTARVERGVGPDGPQAVRISPGTFNRGSTEWSRPVTAQPTSQMPVLQIEWDALLTSNALPSEAWQTVLYDTNGAVLGGLMITPDGTAVLPPPPIPNGHPGSVPRDVWNHFEVRLDFNASTVDIFMNGSPLIVDPILNPGLTTSGPIGSIAFAVINPGFDEEILDNLSIQPTALTCHANCDGSSDPPILNVNDFLCFQRAFILALSLPPRLQIESYANFDGSTVEPVLNANDYMAFLSAFAGGCR